MHVDVIIPSKTSKEFLAMTKNCIDSLRSSEEDIKFNVVVVESEKDMPLHAGQDQTIKWEHAEFNYNGALNLGINTTSNDWVVLANNDLIFHKNWMSEILKVHETHAGVKAYSPWNSYNRWHENKYGDTGYSIFFGLGLGYEASTWCIVIKRDLLKQIHLTDKVNFWYSDNNYISELIRLGQTQALVRSSKVDHLGSMTIVKEDKLYDLTVRQFIAFNALSHVEDNDVLKTIASYAQNKLVCELGVIEPYTSALHNSSARIVSVDTSGKDCIEDFLLYDMPVVDMLLINSCRYYAYLKRILEKNHAKVLHCILIPNTEAFGKASDIAMVAQAHLHWHERNTGFSRQELLAGLLPAIEEFLLEHKDWERGEDLKSHGGLTVLWRVS
jgi:glycosyltransferase involved in cell wall biosynthesis